MPNPPEPICKFEQGCHRVVACDPGCGTVDLLAEATRPAMPPVDRSAVLREAIDLAREEGHRLEEAAGIEAAHGARSVAYLLRKLLAKEGPRRPAAEAQQPATEAHSCSNCEGVDPDTCFMNPNRPPEQCPDSESDGYGLQCQKPVGHNLCTFEEEQRAADEPRAVTHARAAMEIRAAARHLYADAGIRVLAALDNAQEAHHG